MNFPMSLSDISLWLAVMAIILLITSEFISSAIGYLSNIIIQKNRLRIVALALGTGFMTTVIMRILQPF